MTRTFLFCLVIALISATLAWIQEVEEKIPFTDTDGDETLNDETGSEPLMRISYQDHQLWRAQVNNSIQRRVILKLREQGHINTWGGSRTNLDILVKPHALEKVEASLRSANIGFNVVIDDIQKAIDNENPPVEETGDDRAGHRLTWKSYHRLSDIYGYLSYLAQTYPNFCQVIDIGKTYQKQTLKVLKISNGNPNNKAMWIDGGIHAREWISPASVTFFINQLITSFDNEPPYMQNLDYYIIPVLNPDGYEYTHTVDRIWRKNRAPSTAVFPGACLGTDLNRNFGHHWGVEGVSTDPCRETYGGQGPFSELESRAVQKFITETPAKWKAYLSFHSYGQYILYPWGYTKAVTPDYKELHDVARKMALEITKVGGPKYTVGPAASTLYPAAGGSDDWAKGTMYFKYSYTIELRDNGRYGFILPASYIKQSGKETYAAIKTVAEAVSKLP